MNHRDVVIVGGGPAGCAAALQLARHAPEIAARTVLLDRAVFPRDKLCGGGVVHEADRLLAHLGVEPTGSSVPIHEICALSADGPYAHRGTDLFRIVRRVEFDHALLRAVEKSGVTVLQGEPVSRVEREASGVRVTTPRHALFAAVVIGADGAKSIVRRELVGPALGNPMVALEAYTDGYADADAHTATFDFRLVEVGLRGYAWDFPSLENGRRILNRGIGGSSWPANASLRGLLDAALAVRRVDLDGARVRGWSAPAYSPESPQSASHVLLAGDAAGVDPWIGEGIASALGGGMLAANVAAEALSTSRFDFSDYRERLRESAVGWELERRLALADPFYAAAAQPGALGSLAGQAAPA